MCEGRCRPHFIELLQLPPPNVGIIRQLPGRVDDAAPSFRACTQMGKDRLHLIAVHAEDAGSRADAIGQERSQFRYKIGVRIAVPIDVQNSRRGTDRLGVL